MKHAMIPSQISINAAMKNLMKKTRPIGQRCILSVSRVAFMRFGIGSGSSRGSGGIGGASVISWVD